MLTLIVLVLLVFVTAVASHFLLGTLLSSGERPEVSVRYSPRRAVEEMTLSQFQELAREYLDVHGWTILQWGNEANRVQIDGEVSEVRFDFEAEVEDPRKLNSLVVEMRKQSLEGLVIFTLADPPESVQKLADRSNITLIPPEPLIDWKRTNHSSQD